MHVIVSGIKFILIDILADFVIWPVWWYTVGLKNRLKFSWVQIKKIWLSLGLHIWLRNLFTPMYGDKSIVGRLISFPVRLIMLVWKLFWFLIWTGIILILFGLWIAGPIAVVWVIIDHFSSV